MKKNFLMLFAVLAIAAQAMGQYTWPFYLVKDIKVTYNDVTKRIDYRLCKERYSVAYNGYTFYLNSIDSANIIHFSEQGNDYIYINGMTFDAIGCTIYKVNTRTNRIYATYKLSKPKFVVYHFTHHQYPQWSFTDTIKTDAISMGTYTEYVDTCIDDFVVKLNDLNTVPVLSINDLYVQYGISFYPNPIKNGQTLRISNGAESIVQKIKIYDIQGRKLIENETVATHRINCDILETGVYILAIKLYNMETPVFAKLIKE